VSDTPRVDSDNRSYPRPEYAEEIVFEGSRHVVISPEAYEELYEIARQLERELTTAQKRIKQLEESLESANTFLQLVMCEQNHLRDLRNKANDRIKRLEEELIDEKNAHAALVADVVLYEDRSGRIKRLEEALHRIANADYRGNRSTESQIAFEALREAKP
jgi:predicted RNase H-like nuclease (RuvC/YqgF family)